MKTKIALVGRPNVGKSSLFNRIVQKRIAIVDSMEGVTRDRLYAKADCFGREFEMIDTGGIDLSGTLSFAEEVRLQAEIAIEESDGIIMVVDSRIGVLEIDQKIAQRLLNSGKPIVLAVNKVDNEDVCVLGPFYQLGIKSMVPVSATQGNHIVEMLEALLSQIPIQKEDKSHLENELKVAIIGRPNVGKSTAVNNLLDQSRCVVSPIAGTTRDAIDVHITYQDKHLTLIDTAGIRRKQSEPEVVDKFATIRTHRAIERADVCVCMLDSQDGITAQEKKIINLIEEKGKGCVLFFNKWDVIKGVRMEHCKKSLDIEASFVSHCPVIFGSAKSGRNMDKIFPAVLDVYHYLNYRVSTGKLNAFIEKTMHRVHPPMINGKRLRIYYMAQVANSPPRFVLFVNRVDLLGDSYKKYLINQFRKLYIYSGVPLVFYLKGKNIKKDQRRGASRKEVGVNMRDRLNEETVGSHL